MNLKDEMITIHVKRRFYERYGLHFNHAMKMKLIDLVYSGGAILVSKTSNARSVYATDLSGLLLNYVYDKRRKKIVTCLFPEDIHEM